MVVLLGDLNKSLLNEINEKICQFYDIVRF